MQSVLADSANWRRQTMLMGSAVSHFAMTSAACSSQIVGIMAACSLAALQASDLGLMLTLVVASQAMALGLAYLGSSSFQGHRSGLIAKCMPLLRLVDLMGEPLTGRASGSTGVGLDSRLHPCVTWLAEG